MVFKIKMLAFTKAKILGIGITAAAWIFATIDPSTLNSLILGIIALMSALTVFLQQRNAVRSEARAQLVADRAAEVKTALTTANQITSDKLESIAKVADNTHTLVNSQFGQQLQTNVDSATALVVAARSLSVLTKSPIDAAALAQAEANLKIAVQRLEQHQKKQTIVDENPAGPASGIG